MARRVAMHDGVVVVADEMLLALRLTVAMAMLIPMAMLDAEADGDARY